MPSRTSTTLLAGLEDPRNEAAWRRFYARYTPMLLSYAKRVGLNDADAQDAVADTLVTFVRAYRLGRYDRERARLKSWLGGIARNKIRKLWAKRRTVSLQPSSAGVDNGLSEGADDHEPDEAFEREWQLETLAAALDVLRQEADPNAYQAFDLYAVKNWPVIKVAALLNMSANAIYIHKSRMLQRLREIVRTLTSEDGA